MKAAKGQERFYPTLALIGVVLLAAWLGDANGGYFVSDWAPVGFVLAAVALLVSAIAPFGGAGFAWDVLALALFAAYTAWTLASLLWSPNMGDAWLGAGQTYLYLLAFLVAVALVALGASRRWVLVASVAGPAVIAALTLRALGSRIGELFDEDRLVGTVGYFNGEAAFLLVSLWVAIYLGASRRVHPIVRGAVLAGATLSLSLAVLTQSRGAMVALAASLPVYFLLSGQRLRGLLALAPVALALFVLFPDLNRVYLALSNGGDVVAALHRSLPAVWFGAGAVGLFGLCWGLVDARWRPPAGMVRVVGGAVLAGCIAAGVIGASAFVERAGETADVLRQKWVAFKTNDEAGVDQSRYLSMSGSGRYTLWRVALEDFFASPVLGVGTYNWEATYYQLRERPTGFARQPHSLPLEVLSERGVVGGALFFGFLGVCVAGGLRRRFTNLDEEGKAQVGALVAAVSYWFVHSSVEWFWQMPAVTLPAIVYLALLAAPWRIEHTPYPPRWPLRVGGVGVGVLAVLIVAPLYVADRGLARANTTEDPRQALVAVERAQRYAPLAPRLALREAELAEEAGEWERAKDAYERAIRLDPEHYAPYAVLAESYEARVRAEEALEHYRRALSLNPLDRELQLEVERLQGTHPR